MSNDNWNIDKAELLAYIQQILAENRKLMYAPAYDMSYLEGSNAMAKELAVEFGLATYEEMRD